MSRCQGMHPDLSPHLHTEKCNLLITELKTCHSQNTFGRFLGYCNDLDKKLVTCLREEVQQTMLNEKQLLHQKVCLLSSSVHCSSGTISCTHSLLSRELNRKKNFDRSRSKQKTVLENL